ncbi:MAG: serine--tRNA ligase, partial [Nitrosopumilaceae archaeon]
MLDPKILRENPDKIRQMLKDRSIDFALDDLIRLDKERRDLIIKTDELRKNRNDISLEIAQKKKSEEDTKDLIEQMRHVSETLSELEAVQTKTESDYRKLAFTIPNLIHETVPVGKDETANKEIRKWGKIPKFNFEIKDHIDISQSLDLVDLERAAKVSGARFYYLKNDLVKLNQALLNYALDFLSEKSYTPVQPPYLINRNSMEGAI